MNRTDVVLVRSPFVHEGFNVFVGRTTAQSNGEVLAEQLGCEWSPREVNVHPDPSFHIDNDAAQSLMDSMWGAGVRPAMFAGPQVMEAQSKHLEDMRAIVSKKIGVELQ